MPDYIPVENVVQANVLDILGARGQVSTVVPANLDFGLALQFFVTCLADFNNSGAVSIQDLFDFLIAYFAWTSGNHTGANPDINGNGEVTVQDLFDFLQLWFAGC